MSREQALSCMGEQGNRQRSGLENRLELFASLVSLLDTRRNRAIDTSSKRALGLRGTWYRTLRELRPIVRCLHVGCSYCLWATVSLSFTQVGLLSTLTMDS